uniref:Leucine-rich repeat-containing N-terminal plant-type domain-containing protein n=1 Tax=Quercus lobata TaxID=97700 RepID=A0A7N2LIE5_QUELO
MMRSLILLSQLFFYLLLLLYSQLASSSSSAPLCSQDQSFALLQFKQLFSFSNDVSFNCDEVDLHSYPKMESWKEGTDCCSWDGVTCDRMKRDVIGLDLSCSWLCGTIPFNSSLFLLPHLQWLNLASNNFSYSSISSRFGQFARLKHLDLSHSMFSGKVPLEISHLSQLASLDLSDYNSYLKLEASVVKRLVQNLTKLRELHLENVEMPSISLSSFMNLSSALTSITLNNCLLCGKLPDHIFRLPNLRELILTDNPELTWSFPMVNWSTPLMYLDVSRTIYSGELPKSIGKMKFIQHLFMSECKFNGSIPAWLGNLTQLIDLDLSINNFSGEMPSSISNLFVLSYFDLRSNNIQGALPIWLGNLTRVTEIFFGTNNFTGQIPSSLSNLKNLTFLGLRYNNIGGRIPNCFANLTKLTAIHLSYNQLTGQFAEFQFSDSLEFLSLDNNRLYGSIPKSISNLVNLSFLDISSNDLNGTVDFNMFKKLKTLLYLNFRANLLHGVLPVPPSSMRNFLISNNRLGGEIPSSICNVTSIEIFDISYNSLSGTIPSCLGNFSNSLVVMDLRRNNFYGTMPETFAEGNMLRTLVFNDLSSNKFHGKIPEVIGMLNFLRGLNLSHNRLIGHISSSLGLLSVLESLDLSSNRLNGEIPMQLTSLTFLAVLNLSQNQLMGPIPQGKQFGTFQNNTYGGNLGLCGFPLSKNCGIDERPPPPIFQEDNDPMFMSGFGWEAVLLGYGFGLVFGIAMGYFMFKIGKPQCLLGLIEENRPRKLKMPSNQRSRGSRNYSI